MLKQVVTTEQGGKGAGGTGTCHLFKEAPLHVHVAT